LVTTSKSTGMSGDQVKLHPREDLIDQAESILIKAISDFNKIGLTNAECISVIADVLGTAITTRTKYMIRRERHGDGNKPGGLE
jgi:hypothetical protein